MATLKELRDERLRKLHELKQLGINPYPANSKRTHTAAQLVERFGELEGQQVTLTGRIVNTRKFGKIAFFVLKDASGSIQLFLRHDSFEPANTANSEIAFEHINLLDPGDFIEVSGPLIKTQTGEISVEAKKLRLLAKSLRPLPTEQEGFTDKEQRLRRRYVDLNVNQDVKERFIRRSRFWQATRDFLNREGFIEINTPVLEHTTGGADANPFVTHMDALDQDFYLRISHELPLKRLIGGGYEKVYDIGPRFRNENYSDEHLPEHNAMEWYWAYADWEQGMQLTEKMIREVLENTFGTLQFTLNGQSVDMNQSWERWDYAGVIRDHYGIDTFDVTLEQVKEQLEKHGLEVAKTENIARGIDKLWKRVRATVAGPVWLINTPAFISPLSKANDQDSRYVQRFQAVIGGSELANGWSELNDPIDQLKRFIEQQQMRDAGDDEAQMLDIDYVEMLEYGMPPTCGLGYSERLFWVFEGVSAREGVIFPQLRSEVDEITKGIYPEVFNKDSVLRKTIQTPAKSQDFSKKIVSVVGKELESWQVANAVAHMNAIIGNKVKKEQLITADNFISEDGATIPRNPQYAIIIKRADQNQMHKLYEEVKRAGLVHHVFVKEMQDTTSDQEITDRLANQTIDEITFYGITFFAENDQADSMTKNFQLFK